MSIWLKNLRLRGVVVLLALVYLSGCATGTNPKDPYESFNRSMYSFNKGLDKVVLRPVAVAYDTVMPEVVDDRVDNAISNFSDIRNFLNSLLQAKFKYAGVSISRLVINSTIGIGGLFDPAKSMGLEQHKEDFGQTLAHWGVGSGPYLMLPFMGPSTVRDAIAKPVPVDVSYKDVIDHVPTRNVAYGLDVINTRQDLLQIDAILADAVDEYAYVRDAWMQNREYHIYDGNPPVQASDEDCDPEYDECGDDSTPTTSSETPAAEDKTADENAEGKLP